MSDYPQRVRRSEYCRLTVCLPRLRADAVGRADSAVLRTATVESVPTVLPTHRGATLGCCTLKYSLPAWKGALTIRSRRDASACVVMITSCPTSCTTEPTQSLTMNARAALESCKANDRQEFHCDSRSSDQAYFDVR